MSRIGSVLCLALFPIIVHAQTGKPSVKQLTPVERKQPDFYHAIYTPGKPLSVEWKFSSPSVELGKEVTLSLVVRNVANAEELVRPKLQGREEFDAQFAVITDDKTLAYPTGVEFRYVVRPRNAGTLEVPQLKYRYYIPNAPSDRRFQTTFPESISLKVTPPPEIIVEKIPLVAHDSFFQLPPSPGTSRRELPITLWISLVILVPLLTGAWILAWRKFFPDAANLVKIRRRRAVRVALDRLATVGSANSQAADAEIAKILKRYLIERHGIPPRAQTPNEVGHAMRQSQLPEHWVIEVEQFLLACDSRRFSPSHQLAGSLQAQAVKLIEDWERTLA